MTTTTGGGVTFVVVLFFPGVFLGGSSFAAIISFGIVEAWMKQAVAILDNLCFALFAGMSVIGAAGLLLKILRSSDVVS